MKKTLSTFIRSLLVLSVALAAATAVVWTKRTEWPTFQPVTDKAPQAVLIVEPDFGYRTGDLIPITIYIKEQPDTTVYTDSLAIRDEYEVVGGADIFARERKDGSRLIRVKFVLQCMNIKPRLSMRSNLMYKVHGDKRSQEFALPVLEISTSPTWDGREIIQDGPLYPLNQIWQFALTGLIILVGAGGLYISTRAIGRISSEPEPRRPILLTPRQEARLRFAEVWRKIEAGDDSVENYKEISLIIRSLYEIKSQSCAEVPSELGQNHPHLFEIMIILLLCEVVIYRPGAVGLSREEKKELLRAFDDITNLSNR